MINVLKTTSSSLLDLAAAFFPGGEWSSLRMYKGGRAPDIINVNDDIVYLGGRSGPTFIEVNSTALDVTVIAIRGTDVGRVQDLMEDFKLYAEPVVFMLLSGVFPTMRLWTGATTSTVIRLLYEMNAFFGLQGEPEYYRPLVQRVQELASSSSSSSSCDENSSNTCTTTNNNNKSNNKNNNNNNNARQVIITGHSLGGGLARIVGALTSIPSVTFSPPGLELSHRKYAVLNKDGTLHRLDNANGALHHQSVAVVTEYDVITQVDTQVGLVQRIQCDKKSQAHQNACHLLEGTICHLLEHCGDPRGRFQSCEYAYDIGSVLPPLLRFAGRNKFMLILGLLSVALIILLALIPEIL